MPNHSRSIIQLDKKTINKIAAGEVVERPASVVKELVENSIDAEATEITILIKDYGLAEIKIIDNGIGMSREDVALAWKAHTTSKLRSVEDLDRITSLGFRGEALASIASVSKMEILTKTKVQKTGTLVRINGGDLDIIEEHECSNGTIITVGNLFYNVPARKKFMKSKQTELSHIIDIVTRQALIHPDIHFKLQHNSSLIINSPRSKNPLEPIISIFGAKSAKKMVPVDYHSEEISITGYISSPALTRASRDNEILYVNDRTIKSKILSEAIEDAYDTLLMKHRYPLIVLNIKIDASKIDVNIHPTKREIRFDDATLVTTVLKEAIRSTLEANDLWRDSETILSKSSKDSVQVSLEFQPITETKVVKTKDDKRIHSQQLVNTQLSIDTSTADEQSEVLATKDSTIIFSDSLWIKPLGQALNLYALCETSEGIAIVDIHAAHERVKYEFLKKKYESSAVEIQELLQPITFTLTPKQAALIQDYHEQFKKLGFTPELFGGNTYIIRTLPVIMDIVQKPDDFVALIEEIRQEIPKLTTLNERIDLILKKMACHSVVRGGDPVTKAKIVRILLELRQCTTPFTCPHGRPTILRISEKALEKEFGRIV